VVHKSQPLAGSGVDDVDTVVTSQPPREWAVGRVRRAGHGQSSRTRGHNTPLTWRIPPRTTRAARRAPHNGDRAWPRTPCSNACSAPPAAPTDRGVRLRRFKSRADTHHSIFSRPPALFVWLRVCGVPVYSGTSP
jgi:hypothetical protein